MKPVIAAAMAILTIASVAVWIERNRTVYLAQTLAEQAISPPMTADGLKPSPPQAQTPARVSSKNALSAHASIYDQNAHAEDAEEVLRGALGRAASHDKKLFLTFGAPGCGWCHRLEDFLARPDIAAILDRDFVVLKIDIDRMTRGKDVMEKYRPEESRRSEGIPWYVVIDTKGDKRATSDLLPGQVKNIGYPGEPEGIDAFMSLIKAESQWIEPGQLAQLREELETAAAKIRAESKRRADNLAAKGKAGKTQSVGESVSTTLIPETARPTTDPLSDLRPKQ
jgi:hypothetical protein